jgi:hypothetical protein
LQNKTGKGVNDEAMKDGAFNMIMSKILVNMRFTKSFGKGNTLLGQYLFICLFFLGGGGLIFDGLLQKNIYYWGNF